MALIGWFTGGSAIRLMLTLLAGAAMGATVTHQVWRAINDRATVERQIVTLKAIEAAQAETLRLQEQADDAANRANLQIQANARAAAGARSELDRLRSTLGTAPADAGSCPSTARRAATLATIFGECSSALEEMGRRADGHATDALKLHGSRPVSD